jgi:SpoVK/Ycf46/Vps4 family AAA+-type ATPase
MATTNFPELFLENLTNRPQRFDDVIEVKRPSSEARVKFLEFFAKLEVTEEDKLKISNSRYDIFATAHIKEIVVRAKLYDISISDSIDKVFEQSQRAIKNFANRKSGMGIGFD